ncbi:MAG TPA: hypothetical protein VMT69_10455 [Kineosporiaceae bacterium]|nr:hypothetical protein [Kineosporiaceae bacterium]
MRERLAATIRSTPGGVLVRSGCLARCASAATILVGWTGAWSEPLVVPGAELAGRLDHLCTWLSGPDVAACVLEETPLPDGLLPSRP